MNTKKINLILSGEKVQIFEQVAQNYNLQEGDIVPDQIKDEILLKDKTFDFSISFADLKAALNKI